MARAKVSIRSSMPFIPKPSIMLIASIVLHTNLAQTVMDSVILHLKGVALAKISGDSLQSLKTGVAQVIHEHDSAISYLWEHILQIGQAPRIRMIAIYKANVPGAASFWQNFL